MTGPRAPVVLIVDDEPRSLDAMEMALEDHFEVRRAPGGEEALRILAQDDVQAILCDQRMPGMTGVELLTIARERWPRTVRIVVTGFTETSDVIRAINDAGIWQFLTKPWHPDQLLMAALGAVRLFQLQREHDRVTLELKQLGQTVERRLLERREAVRRASGFERILRAPGSPMEAVCAEAAQIASFDVPALILGETGVGKELLARAIHYGSLRADRPFHAVHCGAIPDELLESELFGHRKGAFTGAHANRVGLLEQADGGTVFLDEIGDTSPAFQVKLLRFLQEGEIRPVGSNDVATVDVRVIAATNRDLEEEARTGRFREDLFFRLAVCPLRVPPLRDRPGDLRALAESALHAACARHRKRLEGFEAGALAMLAAHDWPGNVRELENEVTRMMMLAQGPRVGAADASPKLRAATGAVPPFDDAGPAAAGSLKDRVERLEARILSETLERCRSNKSRAAEELGLSRVGLRAKLDRYGLERAAQAAE